MVWAWGEACGVEEGGVFGGTVAFALSAVHEEGGVFGDVERAGFVRIDEGVVDDEETAFGERCGGDGEELGDFGDVPVVEDIGEEVDVGVVGEACEHVACGDGDLVGAIAGGDEIGGDAVDGGLVEDDGVEVWVGGGEGAGVDAGAAADVDEVVVGGKVEGGGEGGSEPCAATVHGVGEGASKGGVFHGLVPVGGVLVAGPAGGFAGGEDLEKVAGDGPVVERGEVGSEVPWGALGGVFAGDGGDVVAAVDEVDEAIGAAEREEDVGWARVEAEGLADAFEGIGLGGEAGEEVEAIDGCGDEVGGVETVAVAVEGETVGGGEGEVRHGGGWKVAAIEGEKRVFLGGRVWQQRGRVITPQREYEIQSSSVSARFSAECAVYPSVARVECGRCAVGADHDGVHWDGEAE